MSVFRNDPQKVALEEYLQPLEEAFLRKVGREGAKAVSPWSGGAKHLDQRFWSIGASSLSIPFARKWLKSSSRHFGE